MPKPLVFHIVGARPNFMKAAPVYFAIQERGRLDQRVVHTGQHYDRNMSGLFFEQLGLPESDFNLEVGSGSHAVQTANIMLKIEELLLKEKPQLLLVYGDVNSTVAAALVATKLGIKVAHVEAGLRSRDRAMPEEVNRVVTDHISDDFFTPSRDGDENLRAEGIPGEKIHFVGNVMIDTLVRLLPKMSKPDIPMLVDKYALVTLHRPSNVDDEASLRKILAALQEISQQVQIVFPVHPRTRTRMEKMNFTADAKRFLMIEPLGYLEFGWLTKNATVVLTDSGGIQEETTYHRVPCLTLRENTERPITYTVGSNQIVGSDMERVKSEVKAVLEGKRKDSEIPEYWEGKAGERIAAVLEKLLLGSPAKA